MSKSTNLETNKNSEIRNGKSLACTRNKQETYLNHQQLFPKTINTENQKNNIKRRRMRGRKQDSFDEQQLLNTFKILLTLTNLV